MEKIKILGAGLSGLAAGINLAKKGFKVQIFEKNEDVGMRFHGDMQGIENWSSDEDVLAFLHRMNVETDFEITPFSVVTFSNGEKEQEFEFSRPLFYLIKRGPMEGSIDQGLKSQAIKSGVKINFKETISESEADIIATGPNPNNIVAYDKGIVFETDQDNIAVCLINNKYAYQGYSYLLVANGTGSICTAIFGNKEKLDENYKKTKKYFVERYKLKIKSPKPVGGVIAFSAQGPYKKQDSYLIGEAAGIQDFLAGFGMKTAMTSGYLAAESIVENKDYEQVAQEWFADYLKAGIANRYLWEILKADHVVWGINKFNKSENPLDFLMSLYNLNNLGEVEYPLAESYIKKNYPQIF